MTTRHIVALGGGGFSMEEATALDDYILGLVDRPRPRVLFVPTASGDSIDYMVRFYRAFETRAEARTLALFRRDPDLESRLAWADVIYVGGGNTANMMALWQLHGVDDLLRRAYQGGTALCGVSAGALCWFESGVTDSFGALRALDGCLGILPGSFCPHYDCEDRRPTYRRLVDAGDLAPGFAADDSCAIHFAGEQVARVLTSRAGAAAYRVEPGGKRPLEVS